MPANYGTLRNYLKNKFPNCTIKVGYEAGFRGFNLYDKLTKDTIECLVIPPHKIREAKCNKQKNDTVDAREISKNAEEYDCSHCFVPDKEIREDRQLSRSFEHIGVPIVTEKKTTIFYFFCLKGRNSFLRSSFSTLKLYLPYLLICSNYTT